MLNASYFVTIDDAVTYHKYKFKKSPKYKFTRYWVGVYFAILFWLRAACITSQSSAIAMILLGIIVAALWPFIFDYFDSIWFRSILKKGSPDFGSEKITLSLTNDTLTLMNSKIQSTIRWQDLAEMAIHGENTYIFLNKERAIIIPKKGFEQEKEYEAIQQFAIAKLGHPT